MPRAEKVHALRKEEEGRHWMQDWFEKTIKRLLRSVVHKGLKKFLPE